MGRLFRPILVCPWCFYVCQQIASKLNYAQAGIYLLKRFGTKACYVVIFCGDIFDWGHWAFRE